MNREERIRKVRELAAKTAPEREARDRDNVLRVLHQVSLVGADEAQRRITAAERSEGSVYLGPVKTPHEWTSAVQVARDAAIEAARHRRTISYGEIKLAIHEVLNMLVGWSMFAELAASVNRKTDGALLSSIIVHKDDGKPGDGFLPYARSQGFDGSLETLQRDVFERFATRP